MAESFAELFEKSLEKMQIQSGEIIKGKVVEVRDNYIIVHAGLKSEALIPIDQFYDKNGQLEVAKGDEVEVALETMEDGYGETILSRREAKRVAAWRRLEDAHKTSETVIGKVTGRVKGGFTVEIGAVKGFLPGSLIDIKPVRDPSYLEGNDIEVKIIKMDQKRNNVVVSRRAVLEAENKAERAALLDKLEEGQVIKGVVKNLTDYGAFIDLGGVDGLLHITDISWKRIKHPSDVLTVGEEISVRILKFDRDRNRVSLGLKQLADDPWSDIADRCPVGTRLTGKVSNVTDYGCFVEIEQGVEGLVHVSEMDWTNKNINPSKVVQVGDQVDVMVLEIDPDRRRISLGIKQCQSNPWKAFADTHKKGEKISGKIKSMTDFGIFVGLDGSIDGLVHLSDISWETAGEEAIRNYSKGQEIEAVILAIDAERERISLGVKQLDEDAFSKYAEANPKGTVVKGTVTEVDAKKALVDLEGGVIGQLRAADMAKGKVDDGRTVINVGDEIEAQITGVDGKSRYINLSIKALEGGKEGGSGKGMTGNEPPPTMTLGDLMKEQLENKEKAD